MSAPNTPWNGTPQGQQLDAVFEGLRNTYSVEMPKHIQSMAYLTEHKLKGT